MSCILFCYYIELFKQETSNALFLSLSVVTNRLRGAGHMAALAFAENSSFQRAFKRLLQVKDVIKNPLSHRNTMWMMIFFVHVVVSVQHKRIIVQHLLVIAHLCLNYEWTADMAVGVTLKCRNVQLPKSILCYTCKTITLLQENYFVISNRTHLISGEWKMVFNSPVSFQ